MEELEDLEKDVKCEVLLEFEESKEAHKGVIWSGLLRWPAKKDIGREIENKLSHLSTIIKSPRMPRMDKLKANAMAYYSLNGKSVLSLILRIRKRKGL